MILSAKYFKGISNWILNLARTSLFATLCPPRCSRLFHTALSMWLVESAVLILTRKFKIKSAHLVRADLILAGGLGFEPR